MELQWKPDFDRCCQRWQNWWKRTGNISDMVLGTVPGPGAEPGGPPDAMELLSGDIDAFADRLEAWAESRRFLGDTVPGCVLCFGADHFAGLLGAGMTADPVNRTTWITPYVTDWQKAALQVDWDSRIAARTLECVRALRKRFDGRMLISPPHLQGNLDCLAALRGVQPLLFDLIDSPDEVKLALERVNDAFREVIRVFREEFATDKFGTVNRHGLYAPDISGLLQCDFSCMISPEMFREFVQPGLRAEAEAVDYAEYHLDGPDALVHIDALAEVDKIRVVQYQPGAALLDRDWREVYRKLDDSGFGQYFFRPSPELCGWIGRTLRRKQNVFDLAQFQEEDSWRRQVRAIGRNHE